MSAFIDSLLASPDGLKFNRNGRDISFHPISDTEEGLKLLQGTVEKLFNNEGRGYGIAKTHETRDYPVDYTDLMLIQLDE